MYCCCGMYTSVDFYESTKKKEKKKKKKKNWLKNRVSFLAIIALSVVQSFTRILIHNAILYINTSTVLGTIANWAAIFGVIASNDLSYISCFIRRFLVHCDTEYRPIESPVSHLYRI